MRVGTSYPIWGTTTVLIVTGEVAPQAADHERLEPFSASAAIAGPLRAISAAALKHHTASFLIAILLIIIVLTERIEVSVRTAQSFLPFF